MTERDKMFAGDWYNANFDEELIEERTIAKDLCFQLNQTRPRDLKTRNKILRELLPNVEDVTKIEVLSPFMVDYGYNISIGEGSFFNHNIYLMDCAKITIGKKCFIGPNCGFYTALHPILTEPRNEGLEMAKPITLADNIWIGADVTILPGVKIGEGSIIGAKSLVSKDIPAGVIAFGNPCRVVKKVIDSSLQI
ncbi:MAG: sugar O-acetyltransferase [Selenomonadaceae bacterium]|nr:sugar O-acetyltransferase [Selenomonadaceae bacterium]MBR1858018.1 sugar O-acetyltransferase [Selenomonadaceae bacterium]